MYAAPSDIKGSCMVNLLKGIVVGLGGVAPGLSGSVLLIIFGLYQQVLDALGTLFVDVKKKVTFFYHFLIFCNIILSFY